jgi:pimeloyl-ACP methyl ester carboxylesterase
MILKVGAWARDPLEFKIKDLNIPILFLYGEYDWMTKDVPDRMLH